MLRAIAKRAGQLFQQSEELSAASSSIIQDDDSTDAQSMATTTQFDFDREIIASAAYQRQINFARLLENRQRTFAGGSRTVIPDRSRRSDDFSSHDALSGVTAALDTTGTDSRDEPPIVLISAGTKLVEPPEYSIADGTAVAKAASPYDSPTTHAEAQAVALLQGLSPGPNVPLSISSSPSLSSQAATTHFRSTPELTAQSSGQLHDSGGIENYLKTKFEIMFYEAWTHPATQQAWAQQASQRKVVFIGDPNCGKSVAIKRLVDGSGFTWIAGPTAPTVFDDYETEVRVNGAVIHLQIADTAGFESYDRLRPLTYPDSHIIVLCCNIDLKFSLENIEEKVSRDQIYVTLYGSTDLLL